MRTKASSIPRVTACYYPSDVSAILSDGHCPERASTEVGSMVAVTVKHLGSRQAESRRVLGRLVQVLLVSYLVALESYTRPR